MKELGASHKTFCVSHPSSGYICLVSTSDDLPGSQDVASVWSVWNKREVFRLSSGSQIIGGVALSESGSVIMILFMDRLNSETASKDEFSFHIRTYNVNECTEIGRISKMAAPAGRIILTVDDLGENACVWIESYRGSICHQISLSLNESRPDYDARFDFRKPSPLPNWSERIMCVSGDGKRLLVVSAPGAPNLIKSHDQSLELWDTEGSNVKKCLIDISLHDYGLLDFRNNLPGFQMEQGLECEVNQWNIYDLLLELRSWPANPKTPYRIVQPQDFDDVQHEQEQFANVQGLLEDTYQSTNTKELLSAIDKCLTFKSIAKDTVLEMRHKLLKVMPDRVVATCWHHSRISEHWASSVFWLDSEEEEKMSIARLWSIDLCGYGASQQYWDTFSIRRIEGRDCVRLNGHSKVSDIASIFLLAESSGNYHKSVARITLGPSYIGQVEWEFSLPSQSEQAMYEDVVVIENTLFRRDDARTLVVNDIVSGAEKARLRFEDDISIMRKLVVTGSNLLGLGMNKSGNILFISENGICLSDFSLHLPSSSFIKDISRSGNAAIYSDSNGKLFLADFQTGEKSCVWDGSERDTAPSWANEPFAERLSSCGKVLAYEFNSHLRVVDLKTKYLVLDWKMPHASFIAPCFDLSGRWLTFYHSENVREVFELMWNV